METILTLNSGQYTLLGFVLTALQGKDDRILSLEETIQIARLVKELTEEELYMDVTECPDFIIMTEPYNAYDTFADWFEENEIYFGDFLVNSEF